MSQRRFDLVVFDLDGTLIAADAPVWKTLHQALGSDGVRRLAALSAGLAGEITYAEWVAEDVAMLREAGATLARVRAALSELRPAPGALELLRRLRAARCRTAVLSGGVDVVVADHLPEGLLDVVFINQLRFDGDGGLVGAIPTPYDLHHKATGVRALGERFGVDARRVAFVGNGRNDVHAAEAAGFAVAWRDAPPVLRDVCDVYEPGPDLMTLARHLL